MMYMDVADFLLQHDSARWSSWKRSPNVAGGSRAVNDCDRDDDDQRRVTLTLSFECTSGAAGPRGLLVSKAIWALCAA